MSRATIFIRVLLLISCLSATWFYMYAIYSARDFFSRSPRIDSGFLPPISILKPISGLDPEAYANLASFCQQTYPEYQVICGTHDDKDPGAGVVRQLINDFPAIDIQLVVSDRNIGTNPKVSNLANMLAAARYPILLISDSDIRVGRSYLQRVVQPLCDPNIGVVTCMYRSLTRHVIGVLEALGVSTGYHPSVLVARKLEGVKFALGSGIVIRRAVLEAIGGFAAIANFLADDCQLGSLASRAGYGVVLSDYVVDHVLSTSRLSELIQRQTRWARGNRVSRPWGYLGLIFTHGTAMSLLLLAVSAGSRFSWAVLSTVWLARLIMGWVVGARYLNDQAVKPFLWLVPVSDLIGFALWCRGFVGNTVSWCGQRFRLTKGGELVPLATEPSVLPANPAHGQVYDAIDQRRVL
jgi:ceramide glucosyltransferase